jgi:flavin reductase (DIM6/NTAB) family NADH-FMN oxidoreductase RutF
VAAPFARIAARLDYPMFVVTAAADGERSGCLVGFTTQVSIHPPRFLAGLSKKNYTYGVATRAPRLAVHVLDEQARAVAELFGGETGDEVDKFDRCRWHPGPDDVPVLDDVVAWFSGPVLDRIDLGDHVGFLLAPDAGECADQWGRPLTFRDVRGMDPGHEA